MEARKETPAFAPVAPKDQWTRNSPGKIFGPPVRTFLRDPSDSAERFHLTSHCGATPTTGRCRWHLRGRKKPCAQLGRKAVVSSPNAAFVLCTWTHSTLRRWSKYVEIHFSDDRLSTPIIVACDDKSTASRFQRGSTKQNTQ